MMLHVDVTRRLKNFELNVSFQSLTDHNTVALFGPSGTGKSMTLQILAGLVTPERGLITLGDQVLFDSAQRINLPAQRRRVGFVPQSYTLFPHLTVRKNILFGVSHWPRERQETRLAELLTALRLEGLQDRRPAQISGGQQQRVALARAMITEPQILLLDEPFAALDSIIRARLQEELLSLKERYRLPIVLVTHDLQEAYTLSEQIVVLEAGQVIQSAERDEVLYRPANEAVARFVGTRNIFKGKVMANHGDSLEITSREVKLLVPRPPFPVTAGQSVYFCIRPESVLFTVPGRSRDRGAEGNYLSSQIIREIAHGTSHTLYLNLNMPMQKTTRDTSYDMQVEVSSEVYRRIGVAHQKEWLLALPREQIHLMPLTT